MKLRHSVVYIGQRYAYTPSVLVHNTTIWLSGPAGGESSNETTELTRLRRGLSESVTRILLFPRYHRSTTSSSNVLRILQALITPFHDRLRL